MMVGLQAQHSFGTDVRDGWATKVDSGDIHKVWINETMKIAL
jgi:hypothetical protein